MKRTIDQWSEIYHITILDPDGWDRTDPDLYKKKMDQETWEKGMMNSTLDPLHQEISNPYTPFEKGCILMLDFLEKNSNAFIVKSVRARSFNLKDPKLKDVFELSILPEAKVFKNSELFNADNCSFIMSAKEFEIYKKRMKRKIIKRKLCAKCAGAGNIHFCKYCSQMMNSIHAYNLIYEVL